MKSLLEICLVKNVKNDILRVLKILHNYKIMKFCIEMELILNADNQNMNLRLI
jgi:hypothetical protein